MISMEMGELRKFVNAFKDEVFDDVPVLIWMGEEEDGESWYVPVMDIVGIEQDDTFCFVVRPPSTKE